MSRILLSEPIDAAGMAYLKDKAEVVTSPDPSEQSVGNLLPQTDALIVRTATRITREMIAAANRLKVISRTGGGLNNVDVDAATEFGVVVCGVKGVQDRSVAEHAVFMMGALARRFAYLQRQTCSGNFKSRYEYLPESLAGKRLGLIGLGRIGKILAEICIQGFCMEVWGYDPYVDADDLENSGIILKKEIPEILESADIISLHVPLTKETRGLMGRTYFGLMKPSAFIINTSRGEVIQEAALVGALKTGSIAGAGLDVFETEPPDDENPLFDFENVILTPHSAALTKDVVAGLAKSSAENAINVLEGREPSYSPNWEMVQEQKKKVSNN